MTDLILSELKDHVMNQFGLTNDYTLIQFKASTMSITLRNESHEITVKVTGQALYDIQRRINLKRQDLDLITPETDTEEIEELIEE